jgi:hypothetical protein
VTPGLDVGPAIDAISGEQLILTAGGIDTHVQYVAPQHAERLGDVVGPVNGQEDAARTAVLVGLPLDHLARRGSYTMGSSSAR